MLSGKKVIKTSYFSFLATHANRAGTISLWYNNEV